MKTLGMDEQKLTRLAESEIIEVCIGFQEESVNWAARIFPWEFVLSRITKPIRGERRLTVVRSLIGQNPPTLPNIPSKRLLIVQSMPGRLRGHYTFYTAYEKGLENRAQYSGQPGPVGKRKGW